MTQFVLFVTDSQCPFFIDDFFLFVTDSQCLFFLGSHFSCLAIFLAGSNYCWLCHFSILEVI